MASGPRENGIASARLAPDTLRDNFADLHPPLSDHEAVVAADRCYFCHDAPCVAACPTSIDIPLFIRQIATGQAVAAGKTILEQNILGGMCARVCPTENLCEQDCVRETAEQKPVIIGQLQRFATDQIMEMPDHPFTRAAPSGKRVAVVGAGPAGLACAHRLATHGHEVTIFEARQKSGGLNEFGIAAYKTVDDFAQAELDWLLGIGGITIKSGQALGRELSLDALQPDFDAVFLGLGLGGVRALGIEGADNPAVRSAVDFIAELRQANDLTAVPVGRRVVVIGGGMTAIDAAVQSRLLGAEDVTLAYRRDLSRMGASQFERDLATSKGVRIITNVQPTAIRSESGSAEITFEYTSGENGAAGETLAKPADQILLAIGQTPDGIPGDLKMDGSGKISVNEAGATSVQGIWAGGDCATGGDDLTVTAVAEGRDAAEDIHKHLAGS